MKSIRLGIVIDIMATSFSTPGEEVERIRQSIKADLEGAKVNLVASGHATHLVTGRPLDLLVIDYGGMLPGCDDMVRFQIRQAIEWAVNNPSGLLYIYTDHTRRIYEDELEDRFSGPGNVVYRFKDDPIGEKLVERIRAWFGLTDDDRTPKPKLTPPRRPKRPGD